MCSNAPRGIPAPDSYRLIEPQATDCPVARPLHLPDRPQIFLVIPPATAVIIESMASRKLTPFAAIAFTLAITFLAAGYAHAANVKVKTGYLTCHEASGWGFIIGSTHKLHCTYSTTKGRTEYYTGDISKYGADIGYLKSAVLLWAVAATTTDLHPGALAGSYGGVTAGISLGVGGGANVLLGGFRHSITLQPISIEGQNGLNVAAGIASMTLHYEGERSPG